MTTLSKVDYIPYTWYNYCMTNKELLAYTAGIIDGEGYIGLIPNSAVRNAFAPKVKVASTNIKLIQFLKDNFGGHFDPLRNHPGNMKSSGMWTLSNKKHVKPFLMSLLPYLILKDEQAKVIIEYCETCHFKEMRQTNKELKEKAVQKRITYYKKIRLLNHRGLPAATTE